MQIFIESWKVSFEWMMDRYASTRVRSLAVETETEALDIDTRTYLN